MKRAVKRLRQSSVAAYVPCQDTVEHHLRCRMCTPPKERVGTIFPACVERDVALVYVVCRGAEDHPAPGLHGQQGALTTHSTGNVSVSWTSAKACPGHQTVTGKQRTNRKCYCLLGSRTCEQSHRCLEFADDRQRGDALSNRRRESVLRYLPALGIWCFSQDPGCPAGCAEARPAMNRILQGWVAGAFSPRVGKGHR